MSGSKWIIMLSVLCAVVSGCTGSETTELSDTEGVQPVSHTPEPPLGELDSKSQEAVAETSTWAPNMGNERILQFPSDVSLGELQVRDWGAKGWDWEVLGQATGTVTVPGGRELYLILHPSALADLSSLAELDVDALQSLSMARSATRDEHLVHIASLTGLFTLDLRMTDVTDEGIDSIAKISGLKALVLPAQITDASVARLETAMPDTKITQ